LAQKAFVRRAGVRGGVSDDRLVSLVRVSAYGVPFSALVRRASFSSDFVAHAADPVTTSRSASFTGAPNSVIRGGASGAPVHELVEVPLAVSDGAAEAAKSRTASVHTQLR
jgi:hypothetical protein